MALALRVLLSCLVFLLSLFIRSAAGEPCFYILKVKTSWDDGSGTNAAVKLQVFDGAGRNIVIEPLDAFGLMDPGHDYFERDSLDFFSIGADCLYPCKLITSTDGAGNRPEWHVEYVEIIVLGNIAATRVGFPVSNWITPGSESTVDICLPFA